MECSWRVWRWSAVPSVIRQAESVVQSERRIWSQLIPALCKAKRPSKPEPLDVDVADIVLDPESQFPVAHLMNPSQPSHVGTPTPGFLHLLRDRNTQMPNHTRLLSALDNVKIGFPIG